MSLIKEDDVLISQEIILQNLLIKWAERKEAALDKN